MCAHLTKPPLSAAPPKPSAITFVAGAHLPVHPLTLRTPPAHVQWYLGCYAKLIRNVQGGRVSTFPSFSYFGNHSLRCAPRVQSETDKSNGKGGSHEQPSESASQRGNGIGPPSIGALVRDHLEWRCAGSHSER